MNYKYEMTVLDENACAREPCEYHVTWTESATCRVDTMQSPDADVGIYGIIFIFRACRPYGRFAER